jgi:hypothetical protein
MCGRADSGASVCLSSGPGGVFRELTRARREDLRRKFKLHKGLTLKARNDATFLEIANCNPKLHKELTLQGAILRFLA